MIVAAAPPYVLHVRAGGYYPINLRVYPSSTVGEVADAITDHLGEVGPLERMHGLEERRGREKTCFCYFVCGFLVVGVQNG